MSAYYCCPDKPALQINQQMGPSDDDADDDE